jgi:elongation factor P
MITASDLRPGATVERDGDLFEVIDFSHMKQGRGTAVIRAKLRNVTTGAVTDETFRPEEKFGRVRIERTEAQLLYKDGENYVVMDNTTFEQTTISPEQLGSGVDYLKENDTLFLLRFDDRLLGVDLPTSVVLEVTESEPGFKGDTANASFKPAVVETGLAVDVPLFVNQGDLIRVDTRTGRYLERA